MLSFKLEASAVAAFDSDEPVEEEEEVTGVGVAQLDSPGLRYDTHLYPLFIIFSNF